MHDTGPLLGGNVIGQIGLKGAPFGKLTKIGEERFIGDTFQLTTLEMI